MLHLNTIDQIVYDTLTKINSLSYLASFALAGGTALALQIGHRKSVDIDLFTLENIDLTEVSLQLQNDFDEINIRRTTPVFIFCNINTIKSDFVKQSAQKLIKPFLIEKGIRMFSVEDIAAMKLNAVCGRGSKKDFYDIYSLLHLFTLKELLDFFDKKFQSDNSWMALKSLLYFEDAEAHITPELIHSYPSWSEIKKFITIEVNKYKF